MTPNPSNFTAASLPNLAGRTFIVTGGNTGIGLETCLQLARKNATVVLCARSEDRAKVAIQKIKKEVPYALVEFQKLVLNDLKQVFAASKEIAARHPKIDVLVNNAGIMATPFALTVDGIEEQFATNHVGHFLLTRELLPTLRQGTNPRIVNLASHSHLKAPIPEGIRFEKMNEESSMNLWERYGQSKLANILFTMELQKRVGDGIAVNSVHPGLVKTELTRGPVASFGWWLAPFMGIMKMVSFLSVEDGALTSLYAAASPEIDAKKLRGRYFSPIAVDATDTERSDLAKDEALGEKLWTFTEQLLTERGF